MLYHPHLISISHSFSVSGYADATGRPGEASEPDAGSGRLDPRQGSREDDPAAQPARAETTHARTRAGAG